MLSTVPLNLIEDTLWVEVGTSGLVSSSDFELMNSMQPFQLVFYRLCKLVADEGLSLDYRRSVEKSLVGGNRIF